MFHKNCQRQLLFSEENLQRKKVAVIKIIKHL